MEILGGFVAIQNNSKSPSSDRQQGHDGDRGHPARISGVSLLLVIDENIPRFWKVH